MSFTVLVDISTNFKRVDLVGRFLMDWLIPKSNKYIPLTWWTFSPNFIKFRPLVFLVTGTVIKTCKRSHYFLAEVKISTRRRSQYLLAEVKVNTCRRSQYLLVEVKINICKRSKYLLVEIIKSIHFHFSSNCYFSLFFVPDSHLLNHANQVMLPFLVVWLLSLCLTV